ncbi:MAG: hypothetical protein ACW981_13105 [Candidatus Hodarchaeales archaeon]
MKVINEFSIDLRLAVLPPCAKEIFLILKKEQLKPADLQQRTNYSIRTVGTALKILTNVNLICKYRDLNDFRSYYYKVNNSIK